MCIHRVEEANVLRVQLWSEEEHRKSVDGDESQSTAESEGVLQGEEILAAGFTGEENSCDKKADDQGELTSLCRGGFYVIG